MIRHVSLCLGLVLLSGAAQAQTHRVFFVGNGFFPEVQYAATGDIIELVNSAVSTASLRVQGGIDIGPANCTNPDQWEDGHPDCDAGAGNNTAPVAALTDWTVTVGPDGSARFMVADPAGLRLLGQLNGVDAAREGAVSLQ